MDTGELNPVGRSFFTVILDSKHLTRRDVEDVGLAADCVVRLVSILEVLYIIIEHWLLCLFEE